MGDARNRMLRHVTMEGMVPQFDDLQRVLGYVDAIDDRTGSTELGGDLFVLPFWNPRFCSAIIRAAEAVGGFNPQAGDPVPGREISLAIISPRLFDAVQQDIGERVWPQLRKHWPLIDYHGINDAFVIKYESGGQEELRLHHDVAQVSASVKLNDDYGGAELEFPRQHVTNSSVPVGTLLAWPSLVTHPHRSTPITNGVKYSLTIWCELPLTLH
ncbi:MAG: 2OG-Fe(II) oxygenase [Ilumatobacteraceae bacterium]